MRLPTVLAIALLALIANPLPAQSLLISAASSLSDVLAGLKNSIEDAARCKVDLNFGGSGQLRMQIQNGAPVDIFISAAESDMDILESRKLLKNESRRNIAYNTLVLVQHAPNAPQENRGQPVDALANSKGLIALGNPEIVPAGKYAQYFLVRSGIYDAIRPRLVFSRSVRETAMQVENGAAEWGFVYYTDFLARKGNSIYLVATIGDEEIGGRICYPAAIIASSHNPAAKAALAFLASAAALQHFRAAGFLIK